MEKTIHKNLVKYAVGRAIFCPGCDTVLDVTRAGLLTKFDEAVGRDREMILCNKCIDKLQPLDALAPIELIDGRTGKKSIFLKEEKS